MFALQVVFNECHSISHEFLIIHSWLFLVIQYCPQVLTHHSFLYICVQVARIIFRRIALFFSSHLALTWIMFKKKWSQTHCKCNKGKLDRKTTLLACCTILGMCLAQVLKLVVSTYSRISFAKYCASLEFV